MAALAGAVSGDGRVIVSESAHDPDDLFGPQTFNWTEATGMVEIGAALVPKFASRGNGISAMVH